MAIYKFELERLVSLYIQGTSPVSEVATVRVIRPDHLGGHVLLKFSINACGGTFKYVAPLGTEIYGDIIIEKPASCVCHAVFSDGNMDRSLSG